MPKPTFQRSAITRILNAAPELRYVAVYHTNDDWLKPCMHNYQHRSFVYVLSADFDDSEHFIYVGQSKAQYARMLMHLQKFTFHHIYLFECEAEQLSNCEAAVIRELSPLYNRNHNPLAERYRQLLSIDYESPKDADALHRHLERKLSYDALCLYGFSLPAAVFSVLEQEAKASNCTCSELLQQILEKVYTKEIARQIPVQPQAQTNLISVSDYASIHGKSQEQIKQYLHKNRVPGAMRIGRDWVLPRDSRFPEDHRRKGAK